jgi:hypothetical protein
VSLSVDRLEPGSCASLVVDIQAPEYPQAFRRHVAIQVEAARKQAWVIDVVGRTTATTWAIPSHLIVELDEIGEGRPRLYIYSNTREQIDRVASNRPDVRIKQCEAGPDFNAYEVMIHAPEAGEADILVYANEKDEPTLNVPVRWFPRPELRVRPDQLLLDPARIVDESVYVITDGVHEEIEVEPTVPWLSVASCERINDDKSRIRVSIVGDEIPAGFDGNVLALRLRSGRSTYFVKGHLME